MDLFVYRLDFFIQSVGFLVQSLDKKVHAVDFLIHRLDNMIHLLSGVEVPASFLRGLFLGVIPVYIQKKLQELPCFLGNPCSFIAIICYPLNGCREKKQSILLKFLANHQSLHLYSTHLFGYDR